MSSSNTAKDKDKDNSAWARASEVNEAMLGIQPYADDSMFFIIRYGHKAQVFIQAMIIRITPNDFRQTTMRAKDYTDLMKSVESLMLLWTKPAGDAGGPAERSKQAADLREHCKSLVKDFPELERDFDQFITASRSTLRAFHGDQL